MRGIESERYTEMLRMKLKPVLGLLMLVVLAAFVACSSDADDATKAPSTQATTPPATAKPADKADPTAKPAADAPAVDHANADRNRTLVIPLGGNQIVNFDNFNPYALGNKTHRAMLSKGVNEMLFYSNLNTGEMIPGQAESFEYNDTYDEITVKIRNGVKWSDGEPFTSADVVFTLNLLNKSGTAIANIPFEKGIMTNIEAIDDLTVRITLKSPNPRWFWRTFVIAQENHVPTLPKHIWEGQNVEEFLFNDLALGWPVSTGAYKVESYSDSSVVLTRRDDWWAAEIGEDTLPEVEKIIFFPAGDRAAQSIMMINNDIDVSILNVGDFIAAKARNSSLRSWNVEGPVYGPADGCEYRIALNNAAPPFDDRDVRWALNKAIDRAAMIDLAYEGSNAVAVMPFSSFGGVQQYMSHVDDIIEEFQPGVQDLAGSAALMEKAGYAKNGDGFWAKDGTTLELELHSPTFLQVIPPVITEQLRVAGFDVVTNVHEGAGNRDFMMTGDFMFTVEVHCGSLREPFDTLNDFHSKWSKPIGERLTYVHASTRYENPEYDALIDEMEAMVPSPTDSEYIELLRKTVRIWLNDMPEIVMAEERHVYTFNEEYWENWATAENPSAAPFFCCWSSPYQIILDLEATQ